MKQKILLLLMVMLTAWNMGAKAETSTTLIDVSDSPVAINNQRDRSLIDYET